MVAATNGSSRNGARLSDARRQGLAQQLNVPQVSNFFTIERYYDIAQTVFLELQSLSRQVQSEAEAALTLEDVRKMDPSQLVYDDTFNTGLDMCYLWGKRYCTFCVEAIPTHNYYNSPKYQTLKHKHAHQMTKVMRVLERVVDQMDVQEQVRLLLREHCERQEQLRLLERHRLLQEKSSGSGHWNNSTGSSTGTLSVQESALEKLKILMPPSAVATPDDATAPTGNTGSTRYRLDDDDDNNDHRNNNHVDPNHESSIPNQTTTLLLPVPPPTPPSYAAVLSAMQNRHGRPASATHDTFETRPPPPEAAAPTTTTPKVETVRPPPPMRQQQDYHKAMYQKYQQMGKIQISPIDTFQGRISESTNGCTVISALIVARHLQEAHTVISNATVQNVIDVQCGPILRTIRKKLGLGGHALIIPSDVHDHLVDDKILRQDQFTGAAGGNIMNPPHYREFLQLLADDHQNGSSNKTTNGKAGATLFFREHVISIVKSIDPQTKQSYYDLIDSMPGILHHGKSMATRTRCVDMESLTILLLWYASRKFSDSNCSYIDRNPWNDNMADLDPRVFQGFVWSS